LAGLPVSVAVFLAKKGRIDMAATDPEQAPEGVEDPRLSSLEERLEKVHRAEAERTGTVRHKPSFTGKGSAQGHRVLSALLGAPLGGALIGWVIDKALDSSPIGLLVMLFLGFGAAVMQVYHISKERVE
jgi:ATP synthase protein I